MAILMACEQIYNEGARFVGEAKRFGAQELDLARKAETHGIEEENFFLKDPAIAGFFIDKQRENIYIGHPAT